MPKLNFLVVAALIGLLTSSCATRLATPEGIPAVSISQYEQMVADKTVKKEVYDGLYNKLTVQATWLDSLLTEAMLSHNARLAQWPEQRYREERSNRIARHAENTEFFVSFYTPERKHSDLANSKTLWKIFLDVNGHRYEGKATKIKMLLSEIQAYYPHHNRWSVPYYVSFPVATSLVENKPAALIFTGALSTAEVNFK